MELISLAIALILGLVLGALMGWLTWGRQGSSPPPETAAQVARLEERSSRLEAVEEQLEQTERRASSSEKEVVRLEVESSAMQARLSELEKGHNQAMQEHKARTDARQKELLADEKRRGEERQAMVNQFKAAAHEIVEHRVKAFDERSKKSIGELVKPLKDQIDGFQKQLKESGKHASEERIRLKEQVLQLTQMNVKMSGEAQNLTRALKGDAKARGNWGEMVLSRILEQSGLMEGREYEREVSHTVEDGQRKRPDVIVRLPGQRDVIIDSKVSLVHYEALCNAENSDDEASALKAHVEALRRHVKNLASKEYQTLKALKAGDYVLMFVPIESSFTEAMRHDMTLMDEALSRNVIIVTPSTLMAVLRTVETMWRQERQAKNALEIAKEAGAMFDKFVGFAEGLEKVGKALNTAQKEHDVAMGRLVSGHGNLAKRAERLKKLGAKTSKSLPQALTQGIEGAVESEGALIGSEVYAPED